MPNPDSLVQLSKNYFKHRVLEQERDKNFIMALQNVLRSAISSADSPYYSHRETRQNQTTLFRRSSRMTRVATSNYKYGTFPPTDISHLLA